MDFGEKLVFVCLLRCGNYFGAYDKAKECVWAIDVKGAFIFPGVVRGFGCGATCVFLCGVGVCVNEGFQGLSWRDLMKRKVSLFSSGR